LLAGQMYEPDVRFELALFGQVEEDRGGEHHGGGGRVVVVGPGGGDSRPAAFAGVAVDVFHVGRVVVIGHDHGPAAILAGNHDHQVAFVGLALLVQFPAARP